MVELRAELERTAALNQRNTVFIRQFRRDIRNSINSIIGYLELLQSGSVDLDSSTGVVRNQMENILRLSESARQFGDLESEDALKRLDPVEVVQAEVLEVRSMRPEAVIETDLPSRATV